MFCHSLNKYLLSTYYVLVLNICSINHVKCLDLARIYIYNNRTFIIASDVYCNI